MTPAARERATVRVPLLVVSTAAWLILIATPGEVHAHHAAARLSVLPRLALDWFVMLAAMMAPLLAAPVRHICDRSLQRQRARSIAAFVIGYVVVWMAAGAILQLIAMRAVVLDSRMSFLFFACAAAVWQCSPLKQQCLNRGHMHPELTSGGRAADAAALRFGFVHGVWCVGSCWALMMLPLLAGLAEGAPSGPAQAGHYDVRMHVVAMALVSLWIAAERMERPMPRAWRVRAPEKALRLVHARLTVRSAL